MNRHMIIGTALSTGAITDEHTMAGKALAALAESDPQAAKDFASKARTPLERVELHVRMQGSTLAAARKMAGAWGAKDPDAALIAAYGE